MKRVGNRRMKDEWRKDKGERQKDKGGRKTKGFYLLKLIFKAARHRAPWMAFESAGKYFELVSLKLHFIALERGMPLSRLLFKPAWQIGQGQSVRCLCGHLSRSFVAKALQRPTHGC